MPITRVLVPFAAGGVLGLGDAGSPGLAAIVFSGTAIWILLLLFHQIGWGKAVRSGILYYGLVAAVMGVAGYLTALPSRPLDPGLPVGERVLVRGEILEDPVSGDYGCRFDLDLDLLIGGDTVCRPQTALRVYISFQNGSRAPSAGEYWQFSGQLSPIRNSGNPGQPDYESIMKRKDRWYRFYAGSADSLDQPLKHPYGKRFSSVRFRKKISSQWQGDRDERSLLNAVCLGDRSGLGAGLQEQYSRAGGMHLLAVSGLHVGLIWWVLNISLGWLPVLFGREIYRALPVLFLLWIYACLTGFSSSVCRAVTMFSIFTLVRLLGHRTLSMNSLLVSAFVLLILDPGRIRDVGFQLSYAAMAGIFLMKPVFTSWFRPANRLLSWSWGVTWIGLAAQLGTAPLVIYYFHRIPVYSLLTNLLALPLLSLILLLFVASFPCLVSATCTVAVNAAMAFLAGLLNRVTAWVASLPGSVLEHLYLDLPGHCILLAAFFSGMALLRTRSLGWGYLTLTAAMLFLIWSGICRLRLYRSSEMVVAHLNRASILTFRNGSRVDHFCWPAPDSLPKYARSYLDETWGRPLLQSMEFPCYSPRPQIGSCSVSLPLDQQIWLIGNDVCKGLAINVSGNRSPVNLSEISDLAAGAAGIDFILFSNSPVFRNYTSGREFPDIPVILDGSNGPWYQPGALPSGIDWYITRSRGAYLERW